MMFIAIQQVESVSVYRLGQIASSTVRMPLYTTCPPDSQLCCGKKAVVGPFLGRCLGEGFGEQLLEFGDA